MSNYIPLRKAVEVTGLHPNTLRKYADAGTIPSFRVPNGDRRFDVSSIVNSRSAVVCYARVSTTKQREDLTRQCNYLREKYPEAEVVADIGSGLNRCRGIRLLAERMIGGERIELIVMTKAVLTIVERDILTYVKTKVIPSWVVLART